MKDRDGRECRTCHLFKPWAEFGWRLGPGKGRRTQCLACDEANPVPGTAAEFIAARWPGVHVPPVYVAALTDAFNAGRLAASLGYGAHQPRNVA